MNIQMLDVELEGIIDRNTIFQVLEAMARICEEKAQYVSEGGSHGEPSAHLAREWNKVARAIERASSLSAGL